MFRTTDIVLITVMIAAAAFTYKTKHEAEAKYAELRALEAQKSLEEDTINLLKADWSLLTQPARLQRLVDTYQEELGLEEIEATQFTNIADLPLRPLTVDELVAELPEAGADETITGAVKP